MNLSDRELLILLESVPSHFAIGKDAFGWWYSLNNGASRFIGFKTVAEALFHFAGSKPWDGDFLTKTYL